VESPEYGNHCGVGRFEVIAALCQGWETCWETMGVMGYRHRVLRPRCCLLLYCSPQPQHTVHPRAHLESDTARRRCPAPTNYNETGTGRGRHSTSGASMIHPFFSFLFFRRDVVQGHPHWNGQPLPGKCIYFIRSTMLISITANVRSCIQCTNS
jgi:hypothetical protein